MATVSANRDIFHSGELAVQERAGATTQGKNSGRMIANTVIPGAIKFVTKQPMVVAGSVDAQGDLWTSIVVGRTGFMTAESRSIDINLLDVVRIDGDPLWRSLAVDHRMGLLVIDLRTRARLRVNGRAEFLEAEMLHVAVEEAYPNCPQYIQRRIYRPSTTANSKPVAVEGSELTAHQRRWISSADTLFVSSAHPSGGVDASHRGGNPGFVQVIDSNRLRIPDYAGNGMFNTLGNFAVNPRAGLVIPDFAANRTLQLTGHVEILWDMDDPANETGGTNRYWEFVIDRWVQIDNALPGFAESLDYSPHNPAIAEH